jgi:hypothetical protein
MIQNDSMMNENLKSTKTAAKPSHDAIMPDTRDATDTHKSVEERLDRSAMETARRAQNRTHINEERTPGNTIFSK